MCVHICLLALVIEAPLNLHGEGVHGSSARHPLHTAEAFMGVFG